VNITGGTITDADGKAYLYSGNAVTPITATTISSKSGIDSNIINSSINTHIFGKHSSGGGSGGFKEVVVSNDGEIICQSKTQSGTGANITSTLNGSKQSLDVNVANEVTLTQQPSYGISFQDPGVYPLTVQQTTNTGNLLKVFSCNVFGNPTYIEQETQLGNIITNTSNTNTSVGTVNTSIGTTNTTLTSTNTKLDTINTSVGTVNTSIGTTNTTLSTINGKLTTTTNDCGCN
jgi:hypothetical protein